MYKICARYYTTRYMCNMCTISIIYITELLHKHYRYQVPDMCVIVAYRIHIIYISYIYLVPDMQPIASILTCNAFLSADPQTKFFKTKNYLRTNQTTNILYSKSSLCQVTTLSEAVEVLTLTVGSFPSRKKKSK